jgi:hypothetical protein
MVTECAPAGIPEITATPAESVFAPRRSMAIEIMARDTGWFVALSTTIARKLWGRT